jgi:acetoin utilization deacetylase AcuC-like enzyme
MSVAWFDSPRMDAHDTGPAHPERPARLEAVRRGLADSGLGDKLVLLPAEPVARGALTAVHSPAYVDEVERLCAAGGGALDADTVASEASFEAALRAAGAVTEAAVGVTSGRFQRAFCSVRPPGHHASRARGMGFCIFNNVAVAAQAVIDAGLARRIAILDWDVHHGNGTQDIFWERGDVFYASWHQYPLYPGTGASTDQGAGEGRGATVNCPLRAGSGDADLLAAWRERILPALQGFGAELVLVSAGFDADGRDPLAGLEVTAAGFEALSREVVRFADRACEGRLVSTLEGGYDLEALAEDVSRHVRTLF